jgi:basic amino acid/polyamine antiporter, APA family
MTLVVAAFAEVASRFSRAGGTYLYARVAFGRFAGIEMAWLTYLVRLTAAATNANLFVIYLAEFWPRATAPVESRALLGLVLLPLVVANYRGVRGGVHTSTVFAAAKLAPLAIFVVAGLFVTLGGGAQPARPVDASAGTWLEAILLLVFAYGWFESALLPLGEARDPRRDAPIALFAALGLCALLYTLVQVVVLGVLADPGAAERPLAAAAQVFLGPLGAWLMAAGALVSVYGYLAAAMVNVPRLIYAMAAEGDLPPRLAAVHPRYRTPHLSVAIFAATVWVFAAAGGFLGNLSLSAVSRLLTYGMVSVALLVFRHRERQGAGVGPAWFRVPAGPLVAALGLAFSAVLALRMKRLELVVLSGTLACGLAHWAWMTARGRGRMAPSPADL